MTLEYVSSFALSNLARQLPDGERWEDGRTGERILIQLPEGRHHVEVRREGASAYEEDVLIRRDRTLTLNVLLE